MISSLLAVLLAPVLVFVALLALNGLDRLTGWFGDHGPMYSDNRKHRRYLARLAREAAADYDFCVALASLAPADRVWLESTGWREPAHASFVRLNDWTP